MLTVSAPCLGQRLDSHHGVRAVLRPASFHVPLGQPVWVTFSIENMTHDPITLSVLGKEPAIPTPEVGLPLPHIFSSGTSSSITVGTESGRNWDTPVGYRAMKTAPILMIAPFSSVGTTLDLREFYPTLRGAGRFHITWKPYGGNMVSDSIVITVASLKRAQVITDAGTMTFRFLYSTAPHHVANFLELAQSGFYNRTPFHHLEPGYFIQGGCPRGDGTGIRTDGKKLKAELSNHPMRKGTVAMALLDDDLDSGSSQFFICNTRQKDWDGRYTIFAELVGDESFATLDKLMANKTNGHGKPDQKISIQSVRLIDAPADELP